MRRPCIAGGRTRHSAGSSGSWCCRGGESVTPPLRAADHTNLEEGLPTRVEDAYPIAYRAFEFQGLARYENLDAEEDDRLTLEELDGYWEEAKRGERAR